MQTCMAWQGRTRHGVARRGLGEASQGGVYQILQPASGSQKARYATLEDVLSDEEGHKRLMAQAKRLMNEFKHRFKILREFDAVIKEMDKVIDLLEMDAHPT